MNTLSIYIPFTFKWLLGQFGNRVYLAGSWGEATLNLNDMLNIRKNKNNSVQMISYSYDNELLYVSEL